MRSTGVPSGSSHTVVARVFIPTVASTAGRHERMHLHAYACSHPSWAEFTKLKTRKVRQKEKLHSSSVHFQSLVKVNAQQALKAKVPPLTGEALYRGQNRCCTHSTAALHCSGPLLQPGPLAVTAMSLLPY